MDANGNIWNWAGKYHLNVHSVWRSSSFQSSVDVLDLGSPAGGGEPLPSVADAPLRESFAGQSFRDARAVEKPLASAICWKGWCGLSRWRMRWFGQRWHAAWARSHTGACTCAAFASASLHFALQNSPIWSNFLERAPSYWSRCIYYAVEAEMNWLLNIQSCWQGLISSLPPMTLYPTAWAMWSWIYWLFSSLTLSNVKPQDERTLFSQTC